MQRLADIAGVSTTRRRFVPLAEPCLICGRITNELLGVEIGGSEIAVFACRLHPTLDVIDQIVWFIVNAFQRSR